MNAMDGMRGAWKEIADVFSPFDGDDGIGFPGPFKETDRFERARIVDSVRIYVDEVSRSRKP